MIGFKSKDNYYAIDFILSKKDQNLDFLRKCTLVVVPILKESNIKLFKQNRININSF